MYNLFSDGTNVQKMGTLSFHPLFVTLGNIDENERKKDHAYRLVGLIPALEGNKQEKLKDEFREARASVFQNCFQAFLSTLQAPSERFSICLN